MISIDEVRHRIARFPKIQLAHLPTPLEALSGLSSSLGGPAIYLKRDDQTGLAFGGNKARKLEFIMADALAKRADSVVTWAGVQSNWCRQVAASAARVGKRAVLVLLKRPGLPASEDGNLLIDRVFKADIRMIEASGERGFLELENVREFLQPVLEEEETAGRSPYLAPIGGSLMEGSMDRPLGALGYVAAFAELLEQSQVRGFSPDSVVLATGSAGTQAGLLAGAKLLSPETRVVGISVAGSSEDVSRYVNNIAQAVLDEIGDGERVSEDDVVVFDDYLGEGYGILNQQIVDAVGFLAREEGILLDPVYTGKAMSGLLDLAGKEYFGQENVVFLHTGGTPALFPYRDGILEGLNR
ncbi:MAG: D-cysteine desulfhydrase family protein [Gemmatimonadota bacterium]|jgi:D-cysteine desulfhydrase family pyridoxal phosphate-dependent enzyme